MTPAQQPVAVLSRWEAWRSRVEYHGIILGVICTLITLTLLLAARVTEHDIALRLSEDRAAIMHQVLPPQLYDNDPLNERATRSHTTAPGDTIDVHIARRGGTITGVAFQTTADGYGGPISLLIGVDASGEILGVRVLAHRETPGLADKIDIRRSDWITTFDGLSLQNTTTAQWAVKKDGGTFDQFTGATITPRAIVNSVRDALEFHARQQPTLPTTPSVTPGGHAP